MFSSLRHNTDMFSPTSNINSSVFPVSALTEMSPSLAAVTDAYPSQINSTSAYLQSLAIESEATDASHPVQPPGIDAVFHPPPPPFGSSSDISSGPSGSSDISFVDAPSTVLLTSRTSSRESYSSTSSSLATSDGFIGPAQSSTDIFHPPPPPFSSTDADVFPSAAIESANSSSSPYGTDVLPSSTSATDMSSSVSSLGITSSDDYPQPAKGDPYSETFRPPPPPFQSSNEDLQLYTDKDSCSFQSERENMSQSKTLPVSADTHSKSLQETKVYIPKRPTELSPAHPDLRSIGIHRKSFKSTVNRERLPDIINDVLTSPPVHSVINVKEFAPNKDNLNPLSAETVNAKPLMLNNNLPLSTSTELFPRSTSSDVSGFSTSAGISPLSSAPDISPATSSYAQRPTSLRPPPKIDLDMIPSTTPVTDISSSVSLSTDIYPFTNESTDSVQVPATASDLSSLSTDTDAIIPQSTRTHLHDSVSRTGRTPISAVSTSESLFLDTHPFASKTGITFPMEDRPKNVDRYTFSFESENSPPPSSSSDEETSFSDAGVTSTREIDRENRPSDNKGSAVSESQQISEPESEAESLSKERELRAFIAKAFAETRIRENPTSSQDNTYLHRDKNDNILGQQVDVPPGRPCDNLTSPLILPRFDISLLCVEEGNLMDPEDNVLPEVDQQSNQLRNTEDTFKIPSRDFYPSSTAGTHILTTSVSKYAISGSSTTDTDVSRSIIDMQLTAKEDDISAQSFSSDDNNNNYRNNNNNNDTYNNNVPPERPMPCEDRDALSSSENSSLLPSEDLYPSSLTSNDYSRVSRELIDKSSSLSTDTFFTPSDLENRPIGSKDASPATDISSLSSDVSFFTTCASSPLAEKVFPDIANNNFSLSSVTQPSSVSTDAISPYKRVSSQANLISTCTPKKNALSTPKIKIVKTLKEATRSESSFNQQLRSDSKFDPRVLSSGASHTETGVMNEGDFQFGNIREMNEIDNAIVLKEQPTEITMKYTIQELLQPNSNLIQSIKPTHQYISRPNSRRSVLKSMNLFFPPNINNSSSITVNFPRDTLNEIKTFYGPAPAANNIKSIQFDSTMCHFIPFDITANNINQSKDSCIYCLNANLCPPPHVFTNQESPNSALGLLPAFNEAFPFLIHSKSFPSTVTITFPEISWEFSFITFPGATYPELMEISSPSYDCLFSQQEEVITTGKTKFFLDLTQLHFLGQKSKMDSLPRSQPDISSGNPFVSCLESLKLLPEKCLTNFPSNCSSSTHSSASIFHSNSDYVQLVVHILCECRRRLWSHYVPTLVCPSDAPPRVTPAEHKLWPKLMPYTDDSFKLLLVSGKLFQEELSKDFLRIFIREFFASLFPGSFFPGTLPLLLSSRVGKEANCSIMTNRGELRNLFQRCLLAAEDSIRCLRWDDLMSTPPPAIPGDPEQPLIYRGVEEDENNLADTDKLIHFDGSLSFLGDVALGEEGESLSTPSSPRSILSTYSQKQKRLVFPNGIKDLDYNLLQSGVSIYPGSQALDGSAVGFVFSSSPLWRNQQITSTQLAQQFLYFSSLTKKHGKSRGLTLVADVRGSTSSTVNNLLEALHLFQTSSEQDLQTVYFLVNEEDQSLIKGSPLYDIHGPLKISLLLSLEMLQSYIAMDQLPQAFDGQLDYNHESWVRFHTKLEPFVADCHLVDKYLKDSLSSITALDKIPSTYDETNRLLWEHEQHVRSVFDAPQLLLLQEEGDTILNQLQQEESYLGYSQDYKEEMLHVKKMYKHLQNSMMNLVKVAETRFHKLEQGLQLRGFENECNKLNMWISTEGRHILNKYNSCIDNLKSAKMLEDQFLKDYFSAMAYIDKGNDLVEEACMLSQSGISTDSATGYRDIVKSLKIHLKTFVDELEETRIKVEGTAKTYHTLDKAYAWALESMKYVVSMKTENCTTEEKLDSMLRDMDTFIQEHPPISPELFAETLTQAKQLKNEKLISQCQRTIARCEETQSKLNSRKTALQRAKVQLVKAKTDSPCNCIVKSSGPDLDDTYLLAPAVSKKTSSWHVTCTSLPTSPKLHPRRSSLPNKGEVVQVSPVSNLSSQNMEEYQEQLFNDGLITEDMSHRIVTSLPKSLTLRPAPDSNDCDTHGNREGGLFSRLPFSKKHMTRTVTIPVAQSHSMSQMQLSSSQTIPRMDGSLTIEPLPRTLSLILQELISTERDYVWALQLIVDNYIPEIKKEDVPQALRGKRNVIFGNIEKIYEFHSQHFLQELEHCKQQPFQIAQTFLSHEEQFYLYALYNKNKPKSDQLMQEHGTVYFRRKQSELNDKMNLSSYLLRPVQRMGKYALLLKQMLKECPESDNEYTDLKNAEEMVKFHLRHGNDLLAMDSLKDCDVNLQEQGRLLRQDEFMVTQGRKKFMRHIFLFEELILFSKTKRNRQGGPESYVYKYSFKTSDIGLTENFRDKSNKFEIWFRRRSLGENYILHAQCSEMKNSWVGEISRLLWKQAIKNRESRKCEMASMGMGNKPCMDLKGDFNINDRLINVNPTQSLARSRNSIAVTSVDHFRNGNKRPISITSLSSTSSSSSGQSANHGLLNSLNLAFEALNAGSNSATDSSPHFNRRSMNSSNESGICTDIFLEGDVLMSNRGISAGSNSAATLPANIRLLSTCARNRVAAERKEEPKEKQAVVLSSQVETEAPLPAATRILTPPTSTTTTTPTQKQADPGKLWLDLSKIRTPPEFKVRVLGPSQPKISSINAEESEL